MNAYEERIEARRARLEARAERMRSSATARIERSHKMAEIIPFGQPILVGHHSEKSDRAYRGRIHSGFSKGYTELKAAEEVEAKAAAVGTGGISSDDPEATSKLAEQLVQLEALQVRMAAANKVIRAFWKSGCRAENTAEELARYFEKMAEVGFNDSQAHQLLKPDCCGRIGFADYALSNNSANIRRIKLRIEQLKKAATREHKEIELEGLKVVQNTEANRIQLFFPGKPSDEMRAFLKSSGFRWAPSEGAWQRQLNNAGVYAAQCVMRKVKEA